MFLTEKYYCLFSANICSENPVLDFCKPNPIINITLLYQSLIIPILIVFIIFKFLALIFLNQINHLIQSVYFTFKYMNLVSYALIYLIIVLVFSIHFPHTQFPIIVI